jgi:cbb3-type cytochrome c oxidase subunit III
LVGSRHAIKGDGPLRRGTACLLLLLLALGTGVGAGCGSDAAKKREEARARAHARLIARRVAEGRRVFLKNCAACHTIEGRVAHPTFIESPIPNLDEVKPRVEYAMTRAENGGFDMPGFHEIGEEKLLAVATYVNAVSGSRIERVTAGASELALGRSVFEAHCLRCHGIAGRQRTSEPTYPGTDFNRVKPSEHMVMERITRGILGEMPSFRGKLTSAQMEAVAAYVTETAGR